MERRIALKVIGAGVAADQLEAAQHHPATVRKSGGAYKLQFFTEEQNKLIDRLTEMIIPADNHSPGASAAKVNLFIDLMVRHSNKGVQDAWRSGLAAVDREAQTRFSQPFLKCSFAEQDQILASMAAHETKPSSDLEKFFVQLKLATIDGYYTSDVGIHKDLRYKGNTVLAEFPGCSHPEHTG
jgi:hypothetical protein